MSESLKLHPFSFTLVTKASYWCHGDYVVAFVSPGDLKRMQDVYLTVNNGNYIISNYK